MLDIFLQPDALISLATLTALEIVLGIDSVIFISILVNKLPAEQQKKARDLGMLLALLFRVGLLSIISYIVGLTQPLFSLLGSEFNARDLILMVGGLFLVYKSTSEIHSKLEGEEHSTGGKKTATFMGVIIQVVILDIVFSLDSVITAIGLANQLPVMVVAVVLAMIVMFVFAKSISDFIQHHPTMKMLALSFLLMVGVLLFVEAFHVHVPKGYVYFSIAFSFLVEMLNIRLRKPRPQPVRLNVPTLDQLHKKS